MLSNEWTEYIYMMLLVCIIFHFNMPYYYKRAENDVGIQYSADTLHGVHHSSQIV